VKNLLLFLLVLAGVGLFFHDKQQTADLKKAEDENAQLTQQLADKEGAFNTMQARMQQLNAQAASQAAIGSQVFQQGAHAAAPQPAAWNSNTLQGSNPLDRPAYSH
jgi:hypothetical protein